MWRFHAAKVTRYVAHTIRVSLGSYLMEVISRFEDGIMHSSDVATKRRRVLTWKLEESQELVLVQHLASCPFGASNVILGDLDPP